MRYDWCSNVLVLCFERFNSVIAPNRIALFQFSCQRVSSADPICDLRSHVSG